MTAGLELGATVDPEGAGFDRSRLERITEHFETRYVSTGKIAGCQIARGPAGSTSPTSARSASWTVERSSRSTEDTIWRIYSMTKPITSVALMQLYEKGCFQLTDPVDRYIPSWAGLSVA